jgi:uncharacterized protein (TIGR03435 family)
LEAALFALAKCTSAFSAMLVCVGFHGFAANAQTHGTETTPSAQLTAGHSNAIAFDVVSIRPAHGAGWLTRFTEDGFDGESVPVQYLLRLAFTPTVAPPDILGRPKWADDTYDIHAKVAPEDVPTYKTLSREQQGVMLQKILADRFQFRFHFGRTTHPIYNLTPVESESKRKRLQAEADYKGEGDNEPLMSENKMLHFRAHPDSMAHLAGRLSWTDDVEHRMVIDRTCLPGYYNFDLAWCPLQATSVPEAATCNGASLFIALKEQLGLQLKPAEASFKTVVIDHIEKPSPN